MVEPLRTVLDRDEDVGNYKPVALLAVAAFVVAVLFVAVTVTLTAVGLITRHPVLEAWLIPLAFLGILLAVAGRWQISMSEGTREGRRLTRLAWWLSVIGGCVYSAYYFGNVIAIQNQARTFVQDVWLQRLKDGKMEEAFVLTLPPAQRKGLNSGDVARRFGDVVAPFRQERYVQILTRAEGNLTIEPLGAAEWKQTPEGLEVMTHWRLRTPEGDFELLIPVIGVEAKEIEGRQWFVKSKSVVLGVKGLTTYGQLTGLLEQEAEGFLNTWVQAKLPTNNRMDLYLDTLPLTEEQRWRRKSEYVARTVVSPIALEMASYPYGAHVPFALMSRLRQPEAACQALVPGCDDLGRALVRWDESRQKRSPAEKQRMQRDVVGQEYIRAARNTTPGESKIEFQLLPNQVRASFPIEVMLPVLNYICQGRVVAVCDDAPFIKELNARKAQIEEPSGPEGARAVTAAAPHNWRINEIVIDLGRSPQQGVPGMPPGMPMPAPVK